MKRCRFAGNVDELGARYYAAAGHPNAFYIQNMWSDHGASARPVEENRIVGSIGSLGATGNTFGLLCRCGKLAGDQPFGPIEVLQRLPFREPTQARAVVVRGTPA